MRHPVSNASSFRLFALILTILSGIHGSVLYFYHGISFEIAIADGFVYHLFFGLLALGLWYVVTFAGLSKDELSLFVTHVGAALITILLQVSLSEFVLQLLFRKQSDYLIFLNDSFIWRLLVGVMYYSITVLIFYMIKYYKDMQERVSGELELQTLLKDSELKMLKSQINPHFIFNSLNSISALTASKADKAREMVIKLSDFLRYSLGKGNNEMNALQQEIENVSLYLDIEKVRFGNKLQFEKKVSEKCMEVKVPNLILQPLFENAIKYGIYDSLEEVKIRLTCESTEDMLTILVMNNFEKEAIISKGEGIGLENVRRRLSLVYGRSDLLEIRREENQFTVVLKIPKGQPTDE